MSLILESICKARHDSRIIYGGKNIFGKHFEEYKEGTYRPLWKRRGKKK